MKRSGLDDVHVACDLDTLPLPAGWRRENCTCAGKRAFLLLSEPGATPLAIPLVATGWLSLHLGVFRPAGMPARLELKLASQPYWRTIQPYVLIGDIGDSVQDVRLGPWRVAAGDQLLIQPSTAGTAAIAWMRLAADAAPVTPPRGRAGAVIDVHDVITRQYRLHQPDDLRAVIAPYAESSFDRICWGTAAGTFRAAYFSNVMPALGECGSPSAAGRTAAGVMAMFRRHRADPLDTVIDFTHRMGMQLWADDRICHGFEPSDASTRHLMSPFADENQSMRVLDIDGKPNAQATFSLAYAGFVDLKVRFLVEQAQRGVDGIHINFTRKLPVVGWEPPVLDSFISAHGLDPRKAPRKQWIAAWLAHRCTFATAFMRQLRAALDAATGGRRVPISVQVPHGWNFSTGMLQCQFEALDVATWAAEGLIDVIAPSENLWLTPISLDRFRPAVKDTSCELWGCVHQRARECLPPGMTDDPPTQQPEAHVDPMLVARAASDLLNQGAHGIYLWEAGELPTVPQRWDVLRHLGDTTRLRSWFTPSLGSTDGRERIASQVVTWSR